MYEHNIATRLIAVEILFLVDDSVKLPLAANRHQLQALRRRREIVDKKIGLTVMSWKSWAVERTAGNRKFFFVCVDVGNLLQAWHNLGNGLANRAGVAHGPPVDRILVAGLAIAQHAHGHVGNDLNFAARPDVPGLAAIREPDVAKHALLRGGLRLFVPRQNRQDDRFLRA